MPQFTVTDSERNALVVLFLMQNPAIALHRIDIPDLRAAVVISTADWEDPRAVTLLKSYCDRLEAFGRQLQAEIDAEAEAIGLMKGSKS